MSTGIAHVKLTLSGLLKLACDGIGLVKGGVSFGSVQKVLALVGDVKQLLENAPGALPELQDLDAAEVGELGSLAYAGVIQIVAACK